MTAGDIAQIMTAAGVLITAAVGAASLIASLHNARKLTVAERKLDAVVEKVDEVHVATNGLTGKLVALTATSAKAEGNLEGRAELKQEQKSP